MEGDVTDGPEDQGQSPGGIEATLEFLEWLP